jgi:hypothetical protein
VIATSAAPPTVDDVLLPNVKLAVDDAPICTFSTAAQLKRVLLQDGLNDCALNSGTQRCCGLLGQTMEAQVPSATTNPGEDPPTLVNLILRRPGFLVHDP